MPDQTTCASCAELKVRIAVLETENAMLKDQPRVVIPQGEPCDECEKPFVKLTFEPDIGESYCDGCLAKYRKKRDKAAKA